MFFEQCPCALDWDSTLPHVVVHCSNPTHVSTSVWITSERGRRCVLNYNFSDVLGWVVVVWRRRFFFLVGMIFCCCSFFFFVLLREECPALPGRLARPWCHWILVLFHPEGAHIVVLKATDSEGWCRRVGCTCVSLSFWHRSKKVGEQHGSYYVMVEYEDLLGSECRLLYSGVSSQGSGMMTQSFGGLRVLLVVLGWSLLF